MMSEQPVMHDTSVVERTYPVTSGKVFCAWADVEQRQRWHFPADQSWVVVEMTQYFDVGGIERFRFGPRAAPNLPSEGRFLDILPNERIVSAGTMHRDDVRISVTLTDQSAFFDGREASEERRNGWGKVFERLSRFLESSRTAKH